MLGRIKKKDFSTVLPHVNAHMYSLHAQAHRFDCRLKGIIITDVSSFGVTHVNLLLTQLLEFDLRDNFKKEGKKLHQLADV